jgi:hypothetical protein
LRDILDLFCLATRMEINMEKSSMQFHALSDESRAHLRSILPFQHNEIEEGIKYLGFYLNHYAYLFNEWLCIFKKI